MIRVKVIIFRQNSASKHLREAVDHGDNLGDELLEGALSDITGHFILRLMVIFQRVPTFLVLWDIAKYS